MYSIKHKPLLLVIIDHDRTFLKLGNIFPHTVLKGVYPVVGAMRAE